MTKAENINDKVRECLAEFGREWVVNAISEGKSPSLAQEGARVITERFARYMAAGEVSKVVERLNWHAMSPRFPQTFGPGARFANACNELAGKIQSLLNVGQEATKGKNMIEIDDDLSDAFETYRHTWERTAIESGRGFAAARDGAWRTVDGLRANVAAGEIVEALDTLMALGANRNSGPRARFSTACYELAEKIRPLLNVAVKAKREAESQVVEVSTGPALPQGPLGFQLNLQTRQGAVRKIAASTGPLGSLQDAIALAGRLFGKTVSDIVEIRDDVDGVDGMGGDLPVVGCELVIYERDGDLEIKSTLY